MTSYSPHDFRLHGPEALGIRAEGCRVTPGATGNEILLDVDDPTGFSVTVHGFDQRRDVHVRLEKIASTPLVHGSGE